MAEVKERPIIMQPHNVTSILAGTKTMTRRVVKPQPVVGDKGLTTWHDIALSAAAFADYAASRMVKRCPYGQVGNRLWVKERHAFLDVTKSALSGFRDGKGGVGPDVWNLYVEYSDGTQDDHSVEGSRPKQTRERGETGWRSSMFMPRWASRITLQITGIRVERLQDISEADAVAEGCAPKVFPGPWWQGYRRDERDGYLDHQTVIGEDPPAWMIEPHPMRPTRHLDLSAREAYLAQWVQINGHDSLNANPFVWVIEFRRVMSC